MAKRKQVFSGDVATLRQNIWQLDLEPIMVKLMDAKEGEGWTLDEAAMHVENYRRFLFLAVTRSEVIVPTTMIDKVWHAHILDTEKYREDCQALFGFFLDHFPYFGLRGEQDAANLAQAFKRTGEIHIEVFGCLPETRATVCGCGAGGCNSGACSSCSDDISALPGHSHARPRLSDVRAS